ncbi:cytochrome c biogenesis CcdA family protein [Streptomyces fungicidicus]|uniref:Cytochrome C biogenesis protein CcdA n=1 Tax=Streptomyces fungicidicus TaxID=68203 RepID=A0A494UL88_9ACTN|nr:MULTISPECIES: cytochrome c biogenesis CcdA family protein [Streptomyces]AYL34127.1 cytochrome C biogenesis protein CcdA [Streptomyces fungicidicus]QKW04361.1 cytochrome c biogenesis protein CcdA [Streptomyces sp. NA02536]
MTDAGILLAFLGGLLALLSPCSALLLPAFFAYSFTNRTRLLRHTAAFYAGLCLTLVPLGAAGSLASRLFIGHRDTLVLVGGWTMIALGVVQLLGLGFGSRRLQQRAGAPTGPASSTVALGAVYGLAGFCAGPILGSILTVAALGGSPLRGGLLLAVYALGMAAPLFVLALLWDRWQLGRRAWLRGRGFRIGRLHLHSTTVLGGLLFITLGAMFLAFDGSAALPSLLDVDTEYAWERRVSALASAVPGHLVLAALAAAVAVGAGVVLVRNSRESGRDRR